MTDTSGTPAQEAAPAPVPAPISANPAAIQWPRDEYAGTSALRAEIITAVQRIRGNDARMQVFMDTMIVGIKHAQARLESDKNRVALALERENEAIARRNRS